MAEHGQEALGRLREGAVHGRDERHLVDAGGVHLAQRRGDVEELGVEVRVAVDDHEP